MWLSGFTLTNSSIISALCGVKGLAAILYCKECVLRKLQVFIWGGLKQNATNRTVWFINNCCIAHDRTLWCWCKLMIYTHWQGRLCLQYSVTTPNPCMSENIPFVECHATSSTLGDISDAYISDKTQCDTASCFKVQTTNNLLYLGLPKICSKALTDPKWCTQRRNRNTKTIIRL